MEYKFHLKAAFMVTSLMSVTAVLDSRVARVRMVQPIAQKANYEKMQPLFQAVDATYYRDSTGSRPGTPSL